MPRPKSFAHYIKGFLFKTASYFIGWFPIPPQRNTEGERYSPSGRFITTMGPPADIHDASSPNSPVPRDQQSADARLALPSIEDAPPDDPPGGPLPPPHSSRGPRTPSPPSPSF